MNHLLYLFLKKTKLNRGLYKLYKNKTQEQIPIGTKEIEEAQTLLNTFQKDPHNSCICQNQINTNPKYDLQIIVPAYNVERYIKECLDSVLSQDTSFSYIVKVINDGSTDNTAKILEAYQKEEHIEIVHQKNKGFSGARNTGLKEINARYLMFLDSDDKLASGAIEALMKMAQATDADIIEGASLKFYGSWVTKRYPHADEKQSSANKLYGFAWGKVYRSELFAHIQFPEGYWFEDTLCALILHPLAKKVSTISQCVYCYRTNFKGISRTFRGKPKCLDSYYICEQLLADRVKLGLPMDEKFLHSIVRQFRLNSNRIASLKRQDIDKAVFIQQSALIKHYFPNIKVKDELTQSLMEGDFSLYQLQATLL
ncbi:glycosyltransferase family 2 protein [Bacteroides mediterraneensis]|uniref:glycosyltransferase family 2 protein n=1 Tax=Bacteroides mediterraneensis TaxID=1841856 RepID=UPI0026EF4A3F|nr:glycosyltransferase family 2 protein [Bacteroides mediterraneensis]